MADRRRPASFVCRVADCPTGGIPQIVPASESPAEAWTRHYQHTHTPKEQ